MKTEKETKRVRRFLEVPKELDQQLVIESMKEDLTIKGNGDTWSMGKYKIISWEEPIIQERESFTIRNGVSMNVPVWRIEIAGLAEGVFKK